MEVNIKTNIIIAIIIFIVFFLAFYLINLYKYKMHKNNKKVFNSLETRFILARNRVLKDDLLKHSFFAAVSIINALIITTTFLVIELVNLSLMFKMMIGFILLMGLIYSLYGIFGRYLEKRYKVK